MAEEFDTDTSGTALDGTLNSLNQRTHSLEIGAGSLAHAMSTAFTQSVSGAKQLDDVLKTLALRVSSLALTQALKPVASGVLGGLNQLFTGLFSGSGTNNAAPSLAAAMGAIKPFAAGGVVATPTYFPLSAGGAGLAGEAGPEAIMPLARGADGRLGVAMSGGASAGTSPSTSRPPMRTASAARKRISPARSPAPSRAANAVCKS
jgi:phage-related minor tail protein